MFGQGFGGISDIEVGPDGYMYVLSFTGAIFRILPTSLSNTSDSSTNTEDKGPNGQATGLKHHSEDQSSSSNDNPIPAVILGINGDSSYSPNPIEIEKGQTINVV